MADIPRVLMFDPYPQAVFGAQRVLLRIAAELTARGAPPAILLPGPGALADAARAARHDVVIVPMPRALTRFGRTTRGRHFAVAVAALPPAWARLRRAIAASGADVVHVNDHRGLTLAAPPARAAGKAVVWHAHMTDVPGRTIERTVGRLVRAVVAPSHAALADLRALPPRTRRHVVPGPIDRSLFEAPPARPSGRGRIVTAARLHPVKGPDVAIRAIAELATQGRDVRLDVYGGRHPGEDDFASQVEDLVGTLGLADRVRLRGLVPDPHREWRDADVYVQPSRFETLALAAAEAMAIGLPVVASAVGGIPELIEDGVTGCLVPPDDPRALAAAIGGLLDDRDRSRAIAAAGRERARELSTDRFVDALAGVWREAASVESSG